MMRLDFFRVTTLALVAALGAITARPSRADGPPAVGPASLEEVERAFPGSAAGTDDASRRRHYKALFAYLESHPRALDLEETRWRLVRIAAECEEWDWAAQRSLEYLTVHPGATHEIDALFARAQALGKLNRSGEAKPLYERLTKKLSPATFDKQIVAAAWLHYGSCCLDADDVEGARTVFRGLRAIFQARADGAPIVATADEELGKLDQVGKPAKPFPANALDLDGKPVVLADYAGKVLLIDFWATWCTPCTKEMPNVAAQHVRWQEKGFEVLGVTIDAAANAQRVRDYVKANGFPWKQIHYATADRNAVADLYGVRGVPHTVLVGRDGKILRVGLRGEALGRFLERMFR